jgi:NAD(P)-dependent dehydrogenase (short-subunit alcohol dehydrogenase family)
MDLGLSGRVAVVTAASKGLGRATAVSLAAEGAMVVLNARSATALEDLAATMPHTVVAAGDITDPAMPGLLVDAAMTRWGRVDIVVGNAGGPPTGRALDVTDEQILDSVTANALASIRLARAAVPHSVRAPLQWLWSPGCTCGRLRADCDRRGSSRPHGSRVAAHLSGSAVGDDVAAVLDEELPNRRRLSSTRGGVCLMRAFPGHPPGLRRSWIGAI